MVGGREGSWVGGLVEGFLKVSTELSVGFAATDILGSRDVLVERRIDNNELC